MIRFYKTLTDTTEELKDNEGTFSPKKIMLLQQTLEESKSICNVELCTVKYKLDGLKEFIAMIENYFMMLGGAGFSFSVPRKFAFFLHLTLLPCFIMGRGHTGWV